MRCVEFLGNIHFEKYVDFLGNTHFETKGHQAGFIHSTESLNNLSKRRVILLGTGANSFVCTNLLKNHNIDVYAYCDNDPALVGKTFMGRQILSPFDVFPDKANHIIVAIDNEKLEDVTDQMAHNKVANFSYFFRTHTIIDFENPRTRDIALSALNCLINIEYAPHIHKNAPLGITQRLMPGLEWWSEVFHWLCDDLKTQADKFKVLDIGPGFGFVSLIIKLLRADCALDWLCLATEDRVEDSFIDAKNQRYPVRKYYGMIEDPAYQLPEKYDIIIMTEVFEHFAAAPVPTLQKIAGLLNKNGRIYLSTPNWEKANLYRSWQDIPSFPGDRTKFYANNKSRVEWMDLNLKHTYLYEKAELLEVFDQCGLRPERFTINNCNNFNIVLEKK